MFYNFASSVAVLPSRTKLVVPAATYEPDWAGYSDLLARFPLNNTSKLSFKLPVLSPNGTFVLAVSWNDESDTPHRYIFWEGGTMYFPVYNGEAIDLDAEIEIWSVSAADAVVPATTLTTSWLNEVTYDAGRETEIIDNTVTLTSESFVTLPPGDPGNPFTFPLVV